MKRSLLSLAVLFVATSASLAQVGGRNTYDFLDLVQPARVSAIGGSNVSVIDSDLNIGYQNPAHLNAEMHQNLAFNFVDYFAGITYGNVAYAHHIDSIGTFSANLIYANYGKIQETDQTGLFTGTEIRSGDVALNLGYSRKMDSLFRLGGNFKLINSSIAGYNSFGVAVDLGASYYNPSRELSAGLVLKNIGAQISSYTSGNREALPFEIQLGISKRLKYAPFRISLTLENLQKWDLTLEDPNLQPETDPLTGDLIPIKQPGFLEKAARHIVIGGELLLSKNFHIRGGFNYRRRAELRLDNRPGMTGFSIGAGFRINRFHLSYARSSYHRVGGTNTFSVTTNLGSFRKVNKAGTPAFQ